MKASTLVPSLGFVASALMLLLKLPLASVGPAGVFWTLAFYALNPPFFLIKLFAPYEVHELEHSIWPKLEYPVALLVSLAWWAFIARAIARRRASPRD